MTQQVTQTHVNFIGQTAKRLRSLVPSGKSLPEREWRQRHRFLVGLTWFHAFVIALIGPLCGYSWDFSLGALFRDGTVLHVLGEAMIVALFAFVGGRGTGSRPLDATLVGFGLMSSSAIFVHLSGGYIELHFHFFVMLIFISLYQDWIPYLLSIGYVAIHHGLVGVLRPEDVYNHPAALNAPWTWAGSMPFLCSGLVLEARSRGVSMRSLPLALNLSCNLPAKAFLAWTGITRSLLSMARLKRCYC